MRRSFDVAVIGLGAMGSAALWVYNDKARSRGPRISQFRLTLKFIPLFSRIAHTDRTCNFGHHAAGR